MMLNRSKKDKKSTYQWTKLKTGSCKIRKIIEKFRKEISNFWSNSIFRKSLQIYNSFKI